MKDILREKPTDKFVVTQIAAISNINIKDIKGKNILDIGCGFGWFEKFAVSKGAKRITGIDINNHILKTAKRYANSKKIFFLYADAICLPFKDNTFDTVVAIEVLEHIPKDNEKRVFDEISRVLKKGGVFYLSSPYRSIRSVAFDPAWWTMSHRHYSKNALRILGKKSGLKVNNITVKGKWWTLLSGLDMYISKWIFRRKRFFEDFFIKKEIEERQETGGFIEVKVKYQKQF